jgi:hypothetical protein
VHREMSSYRGLDVMACSGRPTCRSATGGEFAQIERSRFAQQLESAASQPRSDRSTG